MQCNCGESLAPESPTSGDDDDEDFQRLAAALWAFPVNALKLELVNPGGRGSEV